MIVGFTGTSKGLSVAKAKKFIKPKNLLKASPKKILKKIASRGLDLKYLGEEPTWEVRIETDGQFADRVARALNWYNYFINQKTGRKYLVEYLEEKKTSKKLLDLVAAVHDDHLSLVTCSLARMRLMGMVDSPDEEKRFQSRLKEIYQRGAEAVDQNAHDKKIKDERAREIAAAEETRHDIFVGDLDAAVSKFFDHMKVPKKFSVSSWIERVKASPALLASCSAHFQAYRSEVEAAGPAYNFLTKKNKKDFIRFLDDLIRDLDARHIFAKKAKKNTGGERKPRKKKEKSVDQVIKKVKFLKESTEYKVTSINPTQIIGASQLWVFNEHYRILSHYVALDKGFSVKGTTLTNWDDKKSTQKRLRVPLDVLPNIVSGGPKAAEVVYEKVKTAALKCNGRLNIHMVLLRSVK